MVGYFARSKNLGQQFAIYVTAQAGLAFCVSLLLTRLLIQRHGANGGFYC